MTFKASSGGIIAFSVDDGPSIGEVDTYAGTNTPSQIDEIAGIEVATSGVKDLKALVATQNIDSGGYFALLEVLRLTKTA
jgi:hypothetical protein